MVRSSLNQNFPATTVAMLLITISMMFLEISDAQIGVCYGNLGNNLPSPAEVVALCNQHNIRRMRIFNPNREILNALRGSPISLMLGVPNEDIPRIAQDVSFANLWVRDNVLNYGNVNFRYIAVGNEISPFDGATARFAPFVGPAMQNIHNAISAAGLGNRIKVSTVMSTAVLGQSYPPSAGVFRPDISGFINPIVRFLVNHNSPFLANVYPYFPFTSDPRDISLEYAIFTARGTVVRDGPYQYQNLFDAIVDATYAALEKTGAGSVEIVVSETGWPSAGGASTSIDIARTYNNNLIRHVRGGTPRRPGRPIETYIFDLIDEDLKSPEYEKHWGLFYPNKQLKYPISFV